MPACTALGVKSRMSVAFVEWLSGVGTRRLETLAVEGALVDEPHAHTPIDSAHARAPIASRYLAIT
jgi:hypothetical protein